MLRRVLPLVLACLVSGRAGAQDATTPSRAPDRPTLFAARLMPGSADGATRRLDDVVAAELRTADTFSLVDLRLPGGRSVDLELRRVHVSTAETLVVVDGRLVADASPEAGVGLWSGRVAGEASSDVFLALSAAGTRGWIRTDDALVHLLADRSPDGAPIVRVIGEASLRSDGFAPTVRCQTDRLAPRAPDMFLQLQARLEAAARAAIDGHAADGAAAPLPLFEGRVAFETDTAFFDLFGDLHAAQTYLVSLIGAVSHRYREDVGVVITAPYLGFHTGDDGWDTPDDGGDVLDMLEEFSGRWGGGMGPVDADLYHFVSGANLIGGIANLFAVCHDEDGFGVSSNLMGQTPFPVTVSPLNWDYFVVAHELGHNFGAMHTHDYCEPLDSCSFSLGQCQTMQACQAGTLMSYCYGCPGGMLNIQDAFHPVVRAAIRFAVEERFCLRPYDGVEVRDLGTGLAGAAGEPRLGVRDELPRGLVLEVRGAAPATLGAVIWSPHLLLAPFFGGTLVPEPTTVRTLVTSALGDADLVARVPAGVTHPAGIVQIAQAWLFDAGGPQGLAATNALELDIVLADSPMPVWIEHPDNGLEYALSSVGSYNALRVEARTHGGDLASIETPGLNDWLVDTFQQPGLLAAFIGLNDQRVEGEFHWTDGSPGTYTHWGANQPNNLGLAGQQAVELTLSPVGFEALAVGDWNDWTDRGWVTNRAIMQRPAGTE